MDTIVPILRLAHWHRPKAMPYDLPRACRSNPSAEPGLTSEISLGERAVSVAGASAKGAGVEIPERATVISGARTRAIGPSATTRTFEVGGVLYATSLET